MDSKPGSADAFLMPAKKDQPPPNLSTSNKHESDDRVGALLGRAGARTSLTVGTPPRPYRTERLEINMASVVALFICPAIGQPMQARASVRALAGRGLEGDRYAAGQGSHSNLPRPAARHVSLIAREDMEASNEELVQLGLVPFEPQETRRNVVVEGVDVYALLVQEFCIGTVRLRGSEPTRPCRIPSAMAGKARFAEAYHGRGGIRAEILLDGTISIGDLIESDVLHHK